MTAMPSSPTQSFTTSSPKHKSLKWLRWPALVVALLGGHVLIMVYAATLAIGAGAKTVPGYGQNDQDWGRQQNRLRITQQLGHQATLDASRTPDRRGQRRLTLRLADANAQALAATDLKLTYYHQAKGQAQTITGFQLQADGTYTAQGRMPKQGFHKFELSATVKDQPFLQQWEQFIW